MERYDRVNINALHLEYSKHCSDALNCAMSEIHTLEMPIQNFNTLGCLTKDTYYKIMCHFKRKLQDNLDNKRSNCILLIGMIDTLTCMIKQRKFFDEYTTNIKHLLIVMVHCLTLLQSYCSKKDFNAQQVKILLNMVETFFNRIKDHEQIDSQIKHNISLIVENLQLIHYQKVKDCDSKDFSLKLKEGNNNFVKENLNENGEITHNQNSNKHKTSEKVLTSNNITNTNKSFTENDSSRKCSFSDITNKREIKKDPSNKNLLTQSTIKFEKSSNVEISKDVKTDVKKDIQTDIKNNNRNNNVNKAVNAFAYMMACSKTVFKKK